MNTYNWVIDTLYTKNEGELQDYVVIACYTVSGTDGEFSSSLSDTAKFSVTSGSFIPYSELTEEIVLGWIKDELGENGVLSITACIDGQIASQKNPPVVPVVSPLPWA